MLSTRELQHSDIPLLLHYWYTAEHSFLKDMGVDISKLPAQEQFAKILSDQIDTPIEKKNAYCIIWLNDETSIGHCNTNPTFFGKEAKMHLHLWKPAVRQKGVGTALLKMTLPYFFNNLEIRTLWCEPYALNMAPNKTLEKLGFEFVKEHITIPGSINFEQPVKLWKMTLEQYGQLNMQQ